MKDLISYLLIAFSIIVLSVYVKTLSPSIAGGDSGELVAEGCHLGVAHPPGYPLYTLLIFSLSKLANYLNFSTSYVANASSAIFTALTGFLIGETVFQVTEQDLSGSLLSIGLFSFSPLIWQYATTSEVFPMNSFFASLLVYLTTLYVCKRSGWIPIVGAFFCGLALCNQHTIILYEIPLILWILVLIRESIFSTSIIIYLITAFLIGLLPYLYLPIIDASSPKSGSWGHTSTLNGFIAHFLRKDYGTFQLFSGESGKNTQGFWERNQAYLKDVFNTQSFPGIQFLCATAIIVSIYNSFSIHIHPMSNDNSSPSKSMNKHKPKPKDLIKVPHSKVPSLGNKAHNQSLAICVLTSCVLFYFGIFHALSNLPLNDRLLYAVHQRFWMQPNVVVFTLAGIGYQQILNYLMQSFLKSDSSHPNELSTTSKRSTVKWFISLLGICGAISICIFQFERNYSLSDQSGALYFSRYAETIMDSLPQDAVLFVNYDMQWTSLRYKHICERYRPDITLINLSMMTYPWFQHKHSLYPNLNFPKTYQNYNVKYSIANYMANFIKLNKGKQVFISGKFNINDNSFQEFFDLVPYGISSEVKYKSHLPTSSEYATALEQMWRKTLISLLPFPDEAKYPEETWEWTIKRDFKNRMEETSAVLLEYAIRDVKANPEPLLLAVYMLEVCLEFDDRAPSNVYKNAGLGHIHLIQNKHYSKYSDSLPPISEVFSPLVNISWPNKQWKSWSSRRVLYLWGKFLSFPESKLDPQIDTIKDIYSKLKDADKK